MGLTAQFANVAHQGSDARLGLGRGALFALVSLKQSLTAVFECSVALIELHDIVSNISENNVVNLPISRRFVPSGDDEMTRRRETKRHARDETTRKTQRTHVRTRD